MLLMSDPFAFAVSITKELKEHLLFFQSATAPEVLTKATNITFSHA